MYLKPILNKTTQLKTQEGAMKVVPYLLAYLKKVVKAIAKIRERRVVLQYKADRFRRKNILNC